MATWTWRDLFQNGDDPITAARRVGAWAPPVTRSGWAEVRGNLFLQARRKGYTHEQIAEMDFADMARQLVREAVAERERRDQEWRKG